MIITRDQVKAQLGISDSSYDAQIDSKLPIIDGKIKKITGRNWNDRIIGNIENGSDYIEIFSYDIQSGNSRHCKKFPFYYDDISEYILVTQQISGIGIPSGSYISEKYNLGTADNSNYPQVQISESCTATTDSLTIFLGFPTCYHDVVAKGVYWLINGTNTKPLDAGSWKSRSVGPLSVTKGSEQEKLDGVSGMPNWFVKGLPRYHS